MSSNICQGCIERDREIELLKQRVSYLEAELAALKALIAKNSSNSHKPPSSDGLARQNRTKSERVRSGKKPGGQPGHKGTTLRKSLAPDRRVRHPVESCSNCGLDLSQRRPDTIDERQVFDLPPVKLDCTAHEVESKICPECGTHTQAKWPAPLSDEPGAAIYGPEIRAFAVYLTQGQLLPYARTSELLEDLTGHHLSPGALVGWSEKASTELAATDQAIADRLANSQDAVHFDETGIRNEGKNGWLHSASTEKLSHFAFHPKRGVEAMNDIGILPRFRGKAVHDRWEPYFRYGCPHGLCGSHNLRDLRFVWEQHHERWAKNMRRLLGKMNLAVKVAKKKGQNRFNAPTMEYWHNRYRAILQAGFEYHHPKDLCQRQQTPTGKRGRKKQLPGKNLLDAMDKREDSYLLFIHDFTVPFTNNQAERDIRMNKVKMKISGCFRSTGGAIDFCRIRSYISTAKKQGWNLLAALKNVFIGAPMPIPDLPG